MVLSWIYSISIITKHLVYEKEKRLRESMKMMGGNASLYQLLTRTGLPAWIHNLGWFLTALVEMIVSCILLTIIIIQGKFTSYERGL